MESECKAARYDIYRAVHKGLRLSLADLLKRLGSLDPALEPEVRRLAADLRAQLDLSALHLQDEERVIHPALERHSADHVRTVREEHDEHRQSINELRALLDRLEAAAASDRPAAAHALYLRFGRFVGDDLRHMHEEETIVLPELHQAFSDAELLAMEHQIVSILTPDQLFAFMRVILPALSPDERRKMLSDMRSGMPAEAFAAMVEAAAKPSLGQSWNELAASLELAA